MRTCLASVPFAARPSHAVPLPNHDYFFLHSAVPVTLSVKCGQTSNNLPVRRPPDDDEVNLEGLSKDELTALNDAAWEAFWGWDCCGPSGLLERVYSALGVSRRAWHGLKCCPEAAGLNAADQESYINMARSPCQPTYARPSDAMLVNRSTITTA